MLAWRKDGRMEEEEEEEEEEEGRFIDKTEMSFWLLLLRCACVSGVIKGGAPVRPLRMPLQCRV